MRNPTLQAGTARWGEGPIVPGQARPAPAYRASSTSACTDMPGRSRAAAG